MTEEVPTEFGRLVKRHREARNMSKLRLAKDTGLSDGYINLIESGGRGKRPARDVVLAIAQALDAPANDLLGAVGLEPVDDGSPTFKAVVGADPLLRSNQKQVLLMLYEVFIGKTAER